MTTTIPHHLRKATACKNLFLPIGDFTPTDVFAMITSNAFKKPTEQIRSLLSQGKEAEANELKRAQYGFTPSSLWFPTRRESNIKEITGNIVIECDHLTQKELEHVAWFVYTDVFSMMGFVTSSGNGFKWICPTNATTIEEHRIAYKQLCDYYSAMFGEGIKGKLDTKQPDPVRLMFLSCDQSNCAFFKTNYSVFHFISTAPVPPLPSQPCPIPLFNDLPTQSLFAKAERATNKRRQYYEGNRNNYVFLLACNCRFFGLNHDDALIEILNRYNYSQREIMSAVKSAYRYK